MKILIVVTAFLFAASANAGDKPADTNLPQQAQHISCEELKASGESHELLAQRGCCSWHKGVCGCSNGRVTCCDGTTSPSCTCAKDDPLATN